jgi:hypothetical protein
MSDEPRYRLLQGKFGPYFYDTKGQAMVLLDVLAKLNEHTAGRIEKLEAILRWLDSRGGLGYDAHDRIRAALEEKP